MNSKVDFVFEKDSKWQAAFRELRSIVLSFGLEETLKWGQACYMYNGNNVVIIHGFKEYCALLFFKGALIKDEKKLLIQQTQNVQSARQMRFTSKAEITKQKADIKALIEGAIEVEKKGLKVDLKKTDEFDMPDEFAATLQQDPALKKAFTALTPGRQRAYLLFFAQPKQEKTRIARIEKSVPAILAGKGLHD